MKGDSVKIYLDVCCLNRPFDDHFQDRIKLEAEAVLSILGSCQNGVWKLIGSEVVDLEISKTPDDERRKKVCILASIAAFKVSIDEQIEKRAIEVSRVKFSAFDALHIASAEKSKANIMLTTDDRLLKKSLQNRKFLGIQVENPVKWLMEVL